MIKKILFTFFLILNSYNLSYAENNLKSDEVFEQIKKSVVSITTRINHSPTGAAGSYVGTGFLVNKEQGIIVTNRHVVDGVSSAIYDITFFNGRESGAKLLYYDNWADFAFLKVDPDKIPGNITPIKINPNDLKTNKNIFVLGKSEGQDFSMHQGRITSLYMTADTLPYHNFRMSLNVKGGSSGSPVCNDKGEAVGLVFAGADSYVLAVNINYVKDTLDALVKNEQPAKNRTGILLGYYSLDKVKKFSKFSEKIIDDYLKKYPDSLNRALAIDSVINDSPATKEDLRLGDIIWEVDGKEIGPNLYLFDKLIAQSKDEVTLTIYRNGEKLSRKVQLYDSKINKVDKFLLFGGAYFFEPSDFSKVVSDFKSPGIMVSNITPGTSFYNLFPFVERVPLAININECEGKKITNLQDFADIIPSLIKKKYFQCSYINYGIYYGFNRSLINNRSLNLVDVQYNDLDQPPTLFYFDEKDLSWKSKFVALGN